MTNRSVMASWKQKDNNIIYSYCFVCSTGNKQIE